MIRICTKCGIQGECRKHRTVCQECDRIASLQRYEKLYGTPEKKKERAILATIRRHEKPQFHLLNNAKRRSEKYNLEFDLTIDDINIPEFCPVLGIKIGVGIKQWDGSPTIDRIDNTKGYTKDNIKIISWKANNLKSFGTIEDFEKILKYMKENL